MHSAIYVMARCLFVTRQQCVETANRIELVLGTEATLDSVSYYVS